MTTSEIGISVIRRRVFMFDLFLALVSLVNRETAHRFMVRGIEPEES